MDTYTHTVKCFTDKQLTRHFNGIEKAVTYANELLEKKHGCRIYPYQNQARKHLDDMIERYKRGEIHP